MEEKQHFKILCVDGGGIKGLYSSQVLAEIEKHTTYAYQIILI